MDIPHTVDSVMAKKVVGLRAVIKRVLEERSENGKIPNSKPALRKMLCELLALDLSELEEKISEEKAMRHQPRQFKRGRASSTARSVTRKRT